MLSRSLPRVSFAALSSLSDSAVRASSARSDAITLDASVTMVALSVLSASFDFGSSKPLSVMKWSFSASRRLFSRRLFFNFPSGPIALACATVSHARFFVPSLEGPVDPTVFCVSASPCASSAAKTSSFKLSSSAIPMPSIGSPSITSKMSASQSSVLGNAGLGFIAPPRDLTSRHACLSLKHRLEHVVPPDARLDGEPAPATAASTSSAPSVRRAHERRQAVPRARGEVGDAETLISKGGRKRKTAGRSDIFAETLCLRFYGKCMTDRP